ncbi:MAG: hypothetical protein EHM93_07275 [Bacteroidales bacterium]|nr:MAG: hypothetical protein EHM93_07275 [Bacteroidales bacterium]
MQTSEAEKPMQRSRGGLTRSSPDNYRDARLCPVKAGMSEGVNGFKVILPSTCLCNATMSVGLPANLRWLRESKEPCDARVSHGSERGLGVRFPFTYSTF